MRAGHLLSPPFVRMGVIAVTLGCWQFIRADTYAPHPLPAVTDGERALAINNAGQIVGWVSQPSGDHRACLWQPVPGRPRPWTRVDLGPGEESEAIAINDLGQVVGYTRGPDRVRQSFLWLPDTPNGTRGLYVDLRISDLDNRPSGINAQGQVVGHTRLPNRLSRAYLWTPRNPGRQQGTVMDLGLGAHPGSLPLGINAGGQVVGWTSPGGRRDRPSCGPPGSRTARRAPWRGSDPLGLAAPRPLRSTTRGKRWVSPTGVCRTGHLPGVPTGPAVPPARIRISTRPGP